MKKSDTPKPPDRVPESERTESSASLDAHVRETRDRIAQITNPIQRKEAKLRALAEWRADRETVEVRSRFELDQNFLWQLAQTGYPLRRSDLSHQTGMQAVVLTQEEFDTIGSFDVILASGQRVALYPEDLDPDDVLIIYPDELGEKEKEE